MPVLLFDLDDTLVAEEPVAVETFLATARVGAARAAVDAERLATDARACARARWYAAPTHPFCKRIGISSWEGLWCRYEGDGAELAALRAWAPTYRTQAWADALALQNVTDPQLAAELGERFGTERRARHRTDPAAPALLTELRRTRRLALLTNGASCLQREKLAASGLAGFFDAVFVSGDIGTGKPHPAIFHHVLSSLQVDAAETVMIGDSLPKDIIGAVGAGLGAVWLNPHQKPSAELPAGVPAITALEQLPSALRR